MQNLTGEQIHPDPPRISLDEHTAVIREIHHRVKNNLQVIVSLFNLEASRTINREVLDVLGSMQNRIRAIANLHERLYSIGDFSAVHFGSYLEALVRDLEGFYEPGPWLKLQLAVTDLALDIDQAVPLALISNELISNAFKHAFPDKRHGQIAIALRYVTDSKAENGPQGAELQVSDDGVGLPRELDISTSESLGFHVIALLTQQLEGSVHVSRERGTSIRVWFPLSAE